MALNVRFKPDGRAAVLVFQRQDVKAAIKDDFIRDKRGRVKMFDLDEAMAKAGRFNENKSQLAQVVTSL
jgi:hypothetical protein